MREKLRLSDYTNNWLNGLPIGNGRLAAMVCADKNKDILTVNHERLWRGDTKLPREAFHAAEYLPVVRNLLEKEDIFRATRCTGLFFGGYGTGSGIKNNLDNYQYAGKLEFKIGDVSGFEERVLDLFGATASAVRKTVKTRVFSEAFCDCENNVLLAKWESEKGERFSGELSFIKERSDGEKQSVSVKKDEIIYDGCFDGGISYRVLIKVWSDGKTEIKRDALKIEKASQLRICCNVGLSVSAEGIEGEIAEYTVDLADYTEIKKKHECKFSGMMSRVDLELGNSNHEDIPLEMRMQNLKNGKNDAGLFKLLFDFGRYLLLSCSVCGELPANLQGKWNCYSMPPWNSDYHYNINLQMNYWIAESTALHECGEVLSRYIINRMDAARKSAENLYGCRGIYFPLADDVWGQCTPESCYYGAWIGAAPWLAQHLWWHYRYSGDVDYLKNSAYSFFKAVAEFYEDYLVEDSDGILQIMPSQSPENRFEEHENEIYGQIVGGVDLPVSICKSSAMDIELAQDALFYAIESAKILGVDEEKVKLWQSIKEKLPEIKVSSDGRIVEWDKEERKETEIGHRHLSHLYGFYPSEILTRDKDEKRYQATKKSLYTRLDNYGIKTGWSGMWAACMLARMGDKERFTADMEKMLKTCFNDNLLDMYPNFYEHIKSDVIFQIDGNLGAAAAVLEALASYWGNTLHLLSCVPDDWKTGHLYGIKMQGGHTVSFAWENGRVTELSVVLGYERTANFEVNGELITVNGKPGEKKTVI